MVVCDLRERDLLITFPSFLIVFILILSELAAAICAKTVKMAAIRQCHCMRLTAGYRHDLLVA